TVLDGEILSFEASPQPFPTEVQLKNSSSPIGGGLKGAVLPFALLQTRIGRKNITKKQLQDAPIAFFAYDLLELNGEDIRNKTMAERRDALEKIVQEVKHNSLQLSPVIDFDSWEVLAQIR